MFFSVSYQPVLQICIMLVMLFFLILFPKIKLKSKIVSLRNEILNERKIVYEGTFSYRKRLGFLFLTNNAVEFYFDRKTKSTSNFYILLKDIVSVSVSGDWFFGKKLNIKTAGEEISIIVDKAGQWQEHINKAINNNITM